MFDDLFSAGTTIVLDLKGGQWFKAVQDLAPAAVALEKIYEAWFGGATQAVAPEVVSKIDSLVSDLHYHCSQKVGFDLSKFDPASLIATVTAFAEALKQLRNLIGG